MIRIAISADIGGYQNYATLISSILRRTMFPVHVRCWCREFLPESFEQGHLNVEFFPAIEEVSGKYPGSSGPSAYDRLLVIRDCPDWDRCLIMDYDQVTYCDLAPLFELDLGDHLLAAHMQGEGVDMEYAMRVWLKRPFPEGWEYVANHPYFLMPPLLNLAEMRKSGTWQKFQDAQASAATTREPVHVEIKSGGAPVNPFRYDAIQGTISIDENPSPSVGGKATVHSATLKVRVVQRE